MDEAIFRTKLDRLREGHMCLLQPDKNEIGRHARKHVPDLMEYTAALEAGYRAVQGRLDAYRGQARGRTLGQMVKNQWSEGACLGYAAMALTQYGTGHDHAAAILEVMAEMMDAFELEEAAEYHQKFLEGRERRTEDESTDCHGLRPRNDKTRDGA